MTEEETKKPSNQPLFPLDFDKSYLHQGMTLRDYFAAKAMEILKEPEENNRKKESDKEFEDFAKKCYKISDYMLKQREGNNG